MPAQDVKRIDWPSTDAYHAAPGFSRSQIVDVLPPEGSPVTFERRHISKVETKRDTAALRGGRLVSDAILCRQGPLKNVVQVPRKYLSANGQRRGNAWKAWKADQDPAVLTCIESEMTMLKGVAAAIRKSPAARRMLERCEKEVGIHWTEVVQLPDLDPETGERMADDITAFLPMKDQIDGVASDVTCELKMMERIDPLSVSSTVYKMHYDLQCHLHQYAVELLTGKQNPVVIIAILHDRGHYEAAVMELMSPDDKRNPLVIGARKLRECLEVIGRGVVTGEWLHPGHGTTLVCPSPAYAWYREEWRVRV